MTIPSRPAPAPPGARNPNAVAAAAAAAAGANATLEQLRLQLLQQQQEQQRKQQLQLQLQQAPQQQQQNGVPKLTIKLPPPPKRPLTPNNTNNNNVSNANSSITRKFPQARYTPATNWDDSPFDVLSGKTQTSVNGNLKKVPPPRPPPPKVAVGGSLGRCKTTPAPMPPTQQSSNILANIFHRKKNTATPTSHVVARRGHSMRKTASSTTVSTTHVNGSSQVSSQSTNWNAAWSAQSFNSSSLTSLNANCSQATAPQEAQLISFDSPPSSPTFTQKSNSDCVSVDSFSSDSNFSSPHNGSVSQPESGFEDDFSAAARLRPSTTSSSPLDPWETLDALSPTTGTVSYGSIGTAPVRNLNTINSRIQSGSDNPLCNGKSLLPPAPTLTMPTIIKPKISQKPKAPRPPTLARPLENGTCIVTSDLPTPPSPPMPQCAPPPPPPPPPSSSLSESATVSLLDVISGKVDALELETVATGGSASKVPSQPYGIALYDFDSAEEGDLCFRENEKIYLLEQVNAEWYRGRTRAGCEGIFPANYIDVKVPLSVAETAHVTGASSATYPSYQKSTAGGLKVRCLYNFPAEVEGDLELKENDLVTILHRINEDWLYGQVNGRQGQFPANFLECVPANIPQS